MVAPYIFCFYLLVITIYWMLFMNDVLIIYSTFINQHKPSYLVSSVMIILQVGKKTRKNILTDPESYMWHVGGKPRPAQVQGLHHCCTCLYFKNTRRIHTNLSQLLSYLSPWNITVIIFILVNNIQWWFSHSLVFYSFVTPWTVAHQAALSMEFSRQEY